MRRSLTLMLLLVASGALVLSGCKKEKKPGAGSGSAAAGTAAAAGSATTAAAGSAAGSAAAGSAKAAAGTAAAAATGSAAGTAAGSGAATASAGDAEKNCGAMYDAMKQMMDALTKKLGKPTKGKKFPPRDKFVTACKELPGPAVRCMNPKVAMKEAAKCKQVMAKVDPAKIAKFQAMMKAK